MIDLKELTSYLDELLDVSGIANDKSNNGLQVQGNPNVENIIGGVDACAALYEQAIQKNADFIFVHHGESWGPGIPYFTGRYARRFELLFGNQLSLYTAHLPLDANLGFGHNALIAGMLGINNPSGFAKIGEVDIGIMGELPKAMTVAELITLVDNVLETSSRAFEFHTKPIKKIGIISGSGANSLEECASRGLDCLVTGDCSHIHYHIARELEIVLITAGHYKTEVPGIRAVLDHLQSEFDVACEFIDIPTGL